MKRNTKWNRILMGVAIVVLCGFSACKEGEDVPQTEQGTGMPVPGEMSGAEQGNTGTENDAYKEAPMLQALVQSGKLPEVKKRIPLRQDVYIVAGTSVGAYGEDVQFAAESADVITGELVSEGLFRYAEDGTVAPNVALSYTVNSDYTKYTIQLREGLRWSDGVLLTADDCIFFYEKLCLPEVFGESLWQCFTVYDEQGMPGKAVFQKLDTYSFEIVFPQSKPEFLSQLLEQGGICFAPEHYFVNLLPEFMGEDAAKAKASAMGYADGTELLRNAVRYAWNVPGVPTLNPYLLSTEEEAGDVKGDYYEFVRNPYYWKVDTEGKQLPYLDRLGFTRISGESQKMMLTTEGFLSVSPLSSEQVAEAEAGMKRGDYRIVRWTNSSNYAVKNGLKNFPDSCPEEEKIRGMGAAHAECWYWEEK